MKPSENEIEIKEVIKVLSNTFQEYIYSILEIDASMPNCTNPRWIDIDTAIRKNQEGYLLDVKKLTKITNSFSDIIHFAIVADKNYGKLKSTALASENQFEFIRKTFFCLIIEDSQIYEIRCDDKYIEQKLKCILGPLPRFICANLS